MRARLLLMGRRLYRFGHVMFGIAFALGLVLWLGYRVLPAFPTMVGAGTAWLHAKLGLVVLLFGFYIVTGRWLKGVGAGTCAAVAARAALVQRAAAAGAGGDRLAGAGQAVLTARVAPVPACR